VESANRNKTINIFLMIFVILTIYNYHFNPIW
jgi:hypothetical protein